MQTHPGVGALTALAFVCKRQSKHTVDSLNLQPADRSGQITAGLPVSREETVKVAETYGVVVRRQSHA